MFGGQLEHMKSRYPEAPNLRNINPTDAMPSTSEANIAVENPSQGSRAALIGCFRRHKPQRNPPPSELLNIARAIIL